jgi:hypothetical protein
MLLLSGTLNWMRCLVPSSRLCKFNQSAATHVALHNSLEHLFTATPILDRRLLPRAGGPTMSVKCSERDAPAIWNPELDEMPSPFLARKKSETRTNPKKKDKVNATEI